MTTHLQILESDQDNAGALTYIATENEWSKLLDTAGLSHLRRSSRDEEKADMMGANGAAPNHGNYAVISIMGPQSSGKSTILNKLFGCQFDVMDHTKGRHQVTTGIWMGTCKKASDLLIMDLEGTDALERKKNRGNFERQTSLMALTLSEVLIINMWAQDIGRAAGMNVDTLRSIIQANLRLFAPNSKTRLLFLIREQSPDESAFGVTPAKILEATTRKVIENVWNELDKPQSFERSSLSDLFDISFFFLPPLQYFHELFHKRVAELHSRFTNPGDPEYYFNTRYHHLKSVPCEGLYTWTKQLWDSVSKDESLNIPDQQKLLATYRCEHALSEAFALFASNSQGLVSELASAGYVPGFGERMDVVIKEALFHYRQTANKYDAETAQFKYDELVEKIEMRVQQMFNRQLESITNEMVKLFGKRLKKACKHSNGQSECIPDLDQLVRDTAEDMRKQFSIKLDDSMITSENPELTNKELYWAKMMDRLRETIKSVQNEQWMMLLKENEKLADDKLLWNISNFLKNPGQDVWRDISTLRIDYHGKALEGHIVKKMKNLMYDDSELEEKIDSLRENVDTLISDQISQFVRRFDQVMQERFDVLFNKEADNGSTPQSPTPGNTARAAESATAVVYVPRDWSNPLLNVRELYTTAKAQCLSMLEFCRDVKLEGNGDLNLQEIHLKLLSAKDITRIEAAFNRFADNEFRNAEDRVRRIKLGISGVLPNNPVTWGIFLFFAWNEIWAMLTNPLYLIMFLLVGGIGMIVYQAHTLGFDVRTVAMQMGQRAVSMVVTQLNNLQQSHMQAVNQQLDDRHRYSSGASGHTSGGIGNGVSGLGGGSSFTQGRSAMGEPRLGEPTTMNNTTRRPTAHGSMG